MTFHHPSVWLLALLALLPVLWWRWRSRAARPAIEFSSIEPLRRAGSTWAVRTRWIVPALRTAALALLIVCLARPQIASQLDRSFAHGIAIQLIIDRSGSMRAMDFQRRGQSIDRFTAVQDVVRDFVLGGENLPGRPNDLIGMIAFARFADSRCPLTMDHAHLIDAVNSSEIVSERAEDGTAIGDAIALGVERLSSLDRRADVRAKTPIKSKIIILLTDGENNVGDIEPAVAAEMARALGIKIYTIGAGSKNSVAPVPVQDPLGRTFIQQMPVSIDENKLRAIAEASGGQYFRASDVASLAEVYAKIDQLERTEIEQRRYMNYLEMAVEPSSLAGWLRLPALVPIVLALLFVEVLCAQTRWRTVP